MLDIGERLVNDYVVRGVTQSGNIRGLACVTTQTVAAICQRHQTRPTASVALGRALSAAVLLGAQLKDRQRVALKFEGSGPLQKILVEADSLGNVRGYTGNPAVDLPLKNGNFDVAAAVGPAGFLIVTKDLGLKEPYKGIVQLYTSEIAEDVAFYLTESEQIPSAVGLGVFIEPDGQVAAAGGFLIQSLPPADETIIAQIIMQIEQMPPLTEYLRDGRPPEDLLQQIFGDVPFQTLGTQPVQFHCPCSRSRMERALISLGSDDLAALRDEGEAEIVCDFCGERYVFTRDELQRLTERIQ